MQVEGGSVRFRRPAATDVVDLVIAVSLSVAAYMLRRPLLPRDGLFYDDAWVAGGAVFGSIGDVPRTGGAHPGFTVLLWLQHHLVGGPVEHLALVPFLVGVLGPALVYACLRSLGYERPSSLLAAAALVVTHAHVIYSGHVKSYTLDVVVVMALAALLPRVADRRWTWRGVVGWIGFAVVIGSLSGYQMLASALAITILVLHPQGDRWRRLTALGVQGLIQAGWVLYARQFVDLDGIEAFMESAYDAHVERSRNPIILGQNVFDHLTRVIDVHPGSPAVILGLVTVGVVVGLVLGALGRLDHRRALASQFALAALAVAAIGGVLHRFPFGPSTTDLSTAWGAPGARHGLWLVPMTALGLCNVIDLAVRAARRLPAQTLLRCAVAASTLLLVTSRWEHPPREPLGAHRLSRVTDGAAAEGAFIVLDEMSAFRYLLLTDRPVHLVPSPDEMVGYLPVPDPAQGVVLGPVLLPSDVVAFVATTRHDELVFLSVDLPYGEVLEQAGWERVQTESSPGYRVSVWRRR